MTIRESYQELIEQLNLELQNLDLLYEDALDVEPNEKNLGLYEHISQAIHAWGHSLEDQIIMTERRGTIMFSDADEDWRNEDEDFGPTDEEREQEIDDSWFEADINR